MIKVNLFSQILANISREKFDKLVNKHQSDQHSKGLKSWTHLVRAREEGKRKSATYFRKLRFSFCSEREI